MSFKEVKEKIDLAVKKLRINDSFLLVADTNERAISHRLAIYLQSLFEGLEVDCEYNRHGMKVKKIELPNDDINWDDTEAKTVFPDIIIHKRNTDRYNLLVIEIKKIL